MFGPYPRLPPASPLPLRWRRQRGSLYSHRGRTMQVVVPAAVPAARWEATPKAAGDPTSGGILCVPSRKHRRQRCTPGRPGTSAMQSAQTSRLHKGASHKYNHWLRASHKAHWCRCKMGANVSAFDSPIRSCGLELREVISSRISSRPVHRRSTGPSRRSCCPPRSQERPSSERSSLDARFMTFAEASEGRKSRSRAC